MTFWTALRESILEIIIGSRHLEAWRAEKKQREECERFWNHLGTIPKD